MNVSNEVKKAVIDVFKLERFGITAVQSLSPDGKLVDSVINYIWVATIPHYFALPVTLVTISARSRDIKHQRYNIGLLLIPGIWGLSPSGEYLENSVSAISLVGDDLVAQALQSTTLLSLEEGYRGSHAFPYFNIHTFTSNGFGMINHHGEVDNYRIKTLWQVLLAVARKFAKAYDDPKVDGVMDYTWFE